MSEFESPARTAPDHTVTADDVRKLSGAATPHFALHVAGRLCRLVAPAERDDPVRQLAEREIDRLKRLAVAGESSGHRQPGEQLLRG